MDNWVISIGTGYSQAPLIRAAKDAGYRVLGVDRAPDLALADDALPISTYDAQQVVAALADHPERRRVRAVLARTSGPAVQSAARAADELDLPGFGMGLAAASLSKSALRDAARQAGVPNVGGQCLAEPPEWQDGADRVIKPDQPLYGKRNVYRARSADELASAFAAAAAESVNGLVECQPYHGGRDLGLVLALSRGRPLWRFLYDELVSEKDGRFQGRGVAGPARRIHPDTHRAILEAAEGLAAHWGSTGFVFFSFRLPASDTALLYEVNPGLCGDGLADRLFPAIWPNQDFFDLDVAIMSGKEPVMPPPTLTRVALVDGRLIEGDELEEVTPHG